MQLPHISKMGDSAANNGSRTGSPNYVERDAVLGECLVNPQYATARARHRQPKSVPLTAQEQNVRAVRNHFFLLFLGENVAQLGVFSTILSCRSGIGWRGG